MRPRRIRMPSLNSDAGFITIENVLENPCTTDEDEDEDGGFITIEKGMVRRRRRRARSCRRPPSSNSFDMAPPDDGDRAGAARPFFGEAADEYDLDKVEDEFLTMLEGKPEKQGRGGDGEFEEEEEETLSLNLMNLSFDMDLDLESLVRAAEMELNKAAWVWTGGRRGAALEKEEHQELVKRWRAGDQDQASPPSKTSPPGSGFGSPI